MTDKKITIELSSNDESLRLIKRYGDTVTRSTITKDQLGSLFLDKWDTGIMPQYGAGIIYQAQSGNKRLIITQQTAKDPSIMKFENPEHKGRLQSEREILEKSFSTPNTVMVFKVEVTPTGLISNPPSIYLTRNPVMDMNEELLSAWWTWNVFAGDNGFGGNICWGNTTPWNSMNSHNLSPFVFAINHFYTQTSSVHYCYDFKQWESYTKTRKFESESFGTLKRNIERYFET